MTMDLTVERLAEWIGARVLEVPGIGRRRWGQVDDGPLVVMLEPGLGDGERADQVGSALLEWFVWRHGWARLEVACVWLRQLVPALLSGLAGAKLLHICAWDGLTSAIEALLALPNFLRF
jgi:hypothetical protein